MIIHQIGISVNCSLAFSTRPTDRMRVQTLYASEPVKLSKCIKHPLQIHLPHQKVPNTTEPSSISFKSIRLLPTHLFIIFKHQNLTRICSYAPIIQQSSANKGFQWKGAYEEEAVTLGRGKMNA